MPTTLEQEQLQERLRHFAMGGDSRCYEWLGCRYAGDGGYTFRVWAPQAVAVSLVGDFCGWEPNAQPMESLVPGVWECSLQGIEAYSSYRYHILDRDGQAVEWSDPFSTFVIDGCACVGHIGGYEWQDKGWHSPGCPPNIYEVHLPSWRRYAGGAMFSYGALQEELIPYVQELGFTHLRLLRFAQGMAPAACHGTPQEFMRFVDACHGAGLGVLLDFTVPDVSTPPQRSMVLSQARHWIEGYHLDGLWLVGDGPVAYVRESLAAMCPTTLFLQDDPGEPKPLAGRSLLAGMPGDYEQQFAGVRSLFAYRLLSYGVRRMFMGDEFGQQKVWDPEGSLDWLLLDYESHRMLRHYVQSLNEVYLETPALWEPVVWQQAQGVLIAYPGEGLVALCNTSPVRQEGVVVGLPSGDTWVELFNSDLAEFGGDNHHVIVCPQLTSDGPHPYQAVLDVPPLSMILCKDSH